MRNTALRVAIAGTGLAGPCLAHGLRRAGIDVELYERDAAVASRGQGYRIHINPEGELALRRCLPQNLYDLTIATSAEFKPGGGVTIFGPNLEERHRVTFTVEPEPSGGRHLTVDRLVLRQILLSGLQSITHYGAAIIGYEDLPDGRMRAFFSDGTSTDADVLVGADGSGSLVRKQALPAARVIDTGLAAIFGKTPLTDEVRALAPERSLMGFSTVLGDDGRFLPLAGMEYRNDPAKAAAEHAPGLAFHNPRDYLMWALGAPVAQLGVTLDRLASMDASALIELARTHVADWHPNIGELVARSDAGTVTSAPMRTSVRMEHWRSRPVTFVGDAIHCMVPSGIGAAVALRDADLLADRLSAAVRGEAPLLEAIGEYERAMLEYGFAAVDASQQVGRQFT